MATLTIRNVPEHLLGELRDAAAGDRRSVGVQTACWLREVARRTFTREERRAILARIDRLREKTYRRHGLMPDSAKLIRKMRDGRAKRWL